MPVNSNLRLNMTGTGTASDPETRAVRYQAALEMAVYADQHGFPSINLEEHHATANGWLPSPLTMAAAIAARTERVPISLTALLVPLYDPVRLAEDIAVVDLLSQGRLVVVAGQGYREVEYHIVDKPFAGRGAWMDHALETLLAAWGEVPFDYKGQTVNVTPKPYTQPHPVLLVAGMSRPAARRAARFGLPFAPPAPMPELADYYREQSRAAHGHEGFVLEAPEAFSFLFVDEDPDRAWDEIGQHLLNEAAEYGSWDSAGGRRPVSVSGGSIEALRAERRYEILTPQACLQRHRERPGQLLSLHPLVGGMPLERGWQCLRLYAEQVLAPLLAE